MYGTEFFLVLPGGGHIDGLYIKTNKKFPRFGDIMKEPILTLDAMLVTTFW